MIFVLTYLILFRPIIPTRQSLVVSFVSFASKRKGNLFKRISLILVRIWLDNFLEWKIAERGVEQFEISVRDELVNYRCAYLEELFPRVIYHDVDKILDQFDAEEQIRYV